MSTGTAPKRRSRVVGSGPRGSYASRVCLRCRSKKQKCILSAEAVKLPNSLDPVAAEHRCSRCSEFGADCVIWEDEARAAKRKRGDSERQESEPHMSNGGGRASTSSSFHSVSRDTSSVDLRNGLGSLAAAAAAAQQHASSQSGSPMNAAAAGPSSMHSSSNSPMQTLATAASARQAPIEYTSGMPHFSPHSQHSGSPPSPHWNSAHSSTQAAQAAPPEMTATQQLLVDNLSPEKTSPSARRKAFSAATLYSSRPVELLSQLLVRTSGWCSNLERGAQSEVPVSPVVLVGEELSRLLEPWVQAHYLWHPDLPSLSELRAKHTEAPSTASGFLLSVLYHITLPNLNPQPLDARILSARLAACVRREALAVLVGAPASPWVIHGLMLLHQHDPVALLSPLPPGEGRGTEGIVGHGLLATALFVADAIQLDQAPGELRRLLDSISAAGGALPTEDTRARVAAAVNRAALWFNLRRWRVAMIIEAVDIYVPVYVREAPEDVLQVDVDAYMPTEPNEAHQLRKTGRILLHVRHDMLRRTVLATDEYCYVDTVAEAHDHEGRVATVTRALKVAFDQIDVDMNHAKRLLTPLLAVSPGIGVMLQAVKLELHVHYDCLVRYSWSFLLFGTRSDVWLRGMTGSKDFLARARVHRSIGDFSSAHVKLRSAQVEQMLLAITDLACAGTSSLAAAPADATKTAVAAIPMLALASFSVHVAKGELDQKAVMMANFRNLREDTSRHVNLLRFAARCLRDMEPAVRRGDIDTETGIRCGNVRLTAASLVSSMAETMGEWKSLIDGHTVVASDAVARSSSSSNPGSSASTPAAQAYAAQQATMAPPYPHAPTGQQASSSSSSALNLPPQALANPLDSMMVESVDWNSLVTDWITLDAGPSEGQDPFDWASIFGFPALPQ